MKIMGVAIKPPTRFTINVTTEQAERFAVEIAANPDVDWREVARQIFSEGLDVRCARRENEGARNETV